MTRNRPATLPATPPKLSLPMPDIVVHHLTIESFRGIKLLDIDLSDSPYGVTFAGTKGSGKTSAIRGIQADLKGAGISPDCIHADADKAQIKIDFSYGGSRMLARRTIRRNGTSTDLTNADGTAVPRAAAQLRAMFGERSLDPMELFNADAKERRRMILDAVPCTITPEQLNRWCEAPADQEWNTEGHGFDVLARVRQLHYERRTKANAVLDDLKARHQVAKEAAEGCRPAQLVDVTVEAAQAEVASTRAALAILHDRRNQAAKRDGETAATRAKIAQLRAQAADLAASPEMRIPTAAEQDEALREYDDAKKVLEAAQRRMKAAEALCNTIEERLQAADRLNFQVVQLTSQADELERVVTSQSDAGPTADEVSGAEQALDAAEGLLVAAQACQQYARAYEAQQALEGDLAEAVVEAQKLDRIVKRLGAEAPAELAANTNAIPGLEVRPDAIFFRADEKQPPVNIELLSDGERLEFCVEVVKRTAGAAKVLVIDKLESLPPSLIPAFVRRVLEGGWVLFATWVRDGAMEVIDCFRLAQEAA